jgi:hypothetical protein
VVGAANKGADEETLRRLILFSEFCLLALLGRLHACTNKSRSDCSLVQIDNFINVICSNTILALLI